MIQAYLDWLFLPRALTDVIRRLVGFIAIPLLLIVWVWEKGGPGPITVPAWRIGGLLLQPPALPEPITNSIFIVAALAGLAVAFGIKNRILLAYLLITLAYFSARDLVASSPHFIMLEMCFIVALLLDQSQSSPTRRLIQLSVFSCYFLAGFNKVIDSAWMSGDSLQTTFFEAAQVHPEFSFLATIDHGLVTLLSLSLAIWEILIAFALFSGKWRKWAIISGILFHLSTLLLDPLLILFGSVMGIGYLAYFPPKASGLTSAELPTEAATDEVEPEVEPSEGEKSQSSVQAGEMIVNSGTTSRGLVVPILATLYIVVIFAVPLRSHFWLGRPAQLQTSYDFMPWSFHLFDAGANKVQDIEVRWLDSSSQWHEFPISGRLKHASGDNDIYAMINHIFATQTGVKQVHVELVNVIRQGKLQQKKSCTTSVPTFVREPSILVEVSIPSGEENKLQ